MTANPGFFRDLAYVFLAAFAGGLLAWRLRIPVVIGYVLAGILISPFTPGPSVRDVHTLELFAEIGVILLMFSVGLEFSLKELLRSKWVALLGGSLGIVLLIAMGLVAGHLLGWTTAQGVVVGAVVSVASTMVLTRLLSDQGQLRTEAGRVMIAITLVEDLVVVVLVTIIPGLGDLGSGPLWKLAGLLGRATAVLVPAFVVAFKVIGPLLTRVARAQRRDLFFMVILAICLGTAALTEAMGLSLALGAFVAGLIISDSEYAHESLAELFPLRESFVALFFVTIGLLIDPRMLLDNLSLVAILMGLIVAGKLIVWTGVVRVFGYSLATALRVAIGLTQIGEFSFVLVQVGRDAALVGPDIYNATLAASLLSILLNVALVRYVPAWLDRRRLLRKGSTLSPDAPVAMELQNHVVLAGFGRVGNAIGSALEMFHVPYVAIESDPDLGGVLRSRKIPWVFGNAAHPHILERVAADRAALAIVTIPEPNSSSLTVRNMRRMNPQLPILGRAHRRADYEALLRAGATEVVQPEMEASATIIRHAFTHLCFPAEQIRAYLRAFRVAHESLEAARFQPGTVMPEMRELQLENAGVAGRSLGSYRIRSQFGVTVIAIIRLSGGVIMNPPAETLLEPGDRLRVMGFANNIDDFAAWLGGSGFLAPSPGTERR